jgi:hypothetical protein
MNYEELIELRDDLECDIDDAQNYIAEAELKLAKLQDALDKITKEIEDLYDSNKGWEIEDE